MLGILSPMTHIAPTSLGWGGDRMSSSLSDRLATILSIAATLFLIGVVYMGISLPQRPAPTEYTLDISARAAGESIVAEGRTNLPDGARLSVIVDRLYRLKGSGTWQSARVGESRTEVKGGRWEASVPVDDDEWVREVAERVNTREIDPVESVRSSLRATVLFTPTVPQVGLVWESMGGGFEGLAKSESARQSGGQWMMQRETLVEQPLPLDLEQRLLATSTESGDGPRQLR